MCSFYYKYFFKSDTKGQCKTWTSVEALDFLYICKNMIDLEYILIQNIIIIVQVTSKLQNM